MEDQKLSGRVIIDTILANMRQQIEELRYSKVVPAAYEVYLHDDDQQRFESLAHEIAAEAVRALEETLDALNRPSRLDRVREWARMPRLPYKKVGPWVVRITRDPEGEVPLGRALVVSQITLAGGDSFEGQRTRRLATLSEPAAARDSRDPVASPTPPIHVVPGSPASSPAPVALLAPGVEAGDTHPSPSAAAIATLAWDEANGPRRYRMTGHEITLGRAAQGSVADVRLATAPDVSRLHARVRYLPDVRRFSIEDLSLLGTTVNGVQLERGVPRDLPSPSDIRLGDAITVRFESEAAT